MSHEPGPPQLADAGAKTNRATERRVFFRDNAIVFSAQLLGKLRGLILLPLLVRGLGVEQYGTWAQLTSFSFLAAGVFGLNLHLPLVKFLEDDPKRAGRLYWTLLLTTVLTTMIGGASLLLFLPGRIAQTLLGSPDVRLVACAAAIALSTCIRNINQNYYRTRGRFLLRAFVELVGTAIELGVIILLVRMGHPLLSALVGMALTGMLIAILTTFHVSGTAPLSGLDATLLRRSMGYVLPLVPATVFMWILDRSDRVIISHFMDQSAVGKYSAHYALGGALTFLQGPLQATLIPRAAQLWDRDRSLAIKHIEDSMRVYVVVAAFAAATVSGLAPGLLRMLAGASVAEGSGPSVLVISIGTALWGFSVLLSSVFFASQDTKRVSLTTTVGAVCNLGLNWVLVPRIGILGAGLTTCVTYAISCAAFVYGARGVAKLRYPTRELVGATIGGAAIAGGLLLLAPVAIHTMAGAAVAAALFYLACSVATGTIPIAIIRRAVSRSRGRAAGVGSE